MRRAKRRMKKGMYGACYDMKFISWILRFFFRIMRVSTTFDDCTWNFLLINGHAKRPRICMNQYEAYMKGIKPTALDSFNGEFLIKLCRNWNGLFDTEYALRAQRTQPPRFCVRDRSNLWADLVRTVWQSGSGKLTSYVYLSPWKWESWD